MANGCKIYGGIFLVIVRLVGLYLFIVLQNGKFLEETFWIVYLEDLIRSEVLPIYHWRSLFHSLCSHSKPTLYYECTLWRLFRDVILIRRVVSEGTTVCSKFCCISLCA